MGRESDVAARSVLRQNYVAWKSWEIVPPSDDQSDTFRGEIERAGIRPGDRVLEVGYGPGTFLYWAQQYGLDVVGLEVVPELVQAARDAGLNVDVADDEHPLGPCETGDYDAVVAFDVLEHLNHRQLERLGDCLTRCLKPGGRLLARFPNGSSPFGRHYQNGDLTHESALNASSIRQLFEPHGLTLEWARDVYVAPGRTRTKRFVRSLRGTAQVCLDMALSQIYWGMRVPLAPNLTVLLRYSGDCER